MNILLFVVSQFFRCFQFIFKKKNWKNKRHALKFGAYSTKLEPVNSHLRPFYAFSVFSVLVICPSSSIICPSSNWFSNKQSSSAWWVGSRNDWVVKSMSLGPGGSILGMFHEQNYMRSLLETLVFLGKTQNWSKQAANTKTTTSRQRIWK